MYKLRLKTSFEAGHYLSWHKKCCQQHGHIYHVEFVVGASGLYENDVVMDLGILEKLCQEIVDGLDHANLNDIFPNPTVEIVARFLFDALVGGLDVGVSVMEVTVWETDTGGVTYCEGS